MAHATNALRTCAVLLTCAILAVLAAGCSTQGKLTVLKDAAEFDQKVVHATRPVLVDFYKDPCPTCVIQEAELEGIFDEYAGKVDFVRFKIREPDMRKANPEIMDRYNLFWVPTVILFVNGQEKQRWVLNHMAMEFRPALDAAIRGAPMPAPVAATVRATPGVPGQWSPDAAVAGGPECIDGVGCKLKRNP